MQIYANISKKQATDVIQSSFVQNYARMQSTVYWLTKMQ